MCSFISIKRFVDAPYSNVLGYPRATNRQIKSRVKEMEKLKISAVSLTGPTTIGGLAILGKGYVGVAVVAKRKNKEIALKIRRTDSQRERMQDEAALLKIANSVNVGPEMFDASRNFLVMEYIRGKKFRDWIDSLKGVGSAKRLKNVIKNILKDCYRLDAIGLDHGELNNISKHVIVGKTKATLIDFESSSTSRRPSNVTSITQAFFIGTGIAKKIQKIYKNPPKDEIIDALRRYKRYKTQENFNDLLQILRL